MKKNKTLKLLFLALFLWTGSSVFAQGNIERVTFSIPKTIFFTDEKIWINGAVSSGGTVTSSKILYAELIDNENKSWALAKMPLENGHTLNFLELSQRIPSGNYLLRVFTRISPNMDISEGLKQRFVTILNPALPPKSDSNKKSQMSADTGSTSVVLQQNSKYRLSELFSPWKAISEADFLEVKLAVKNKYLRGFEGYINSKDIYEKVSLKPFLPELFGHIVHVKLGSEKADTTQTYFLSAHGVQSALFTDRPDKEGNLYFDLGSFRHWNHLLIQVEDGSSIPDLDMVSPSPITVFKSGSNFPQLTISPEDGDYLNQLKIASALEPYFSQEYNNDSVPVVTGFVADHVYILDDYTRFESVETIIKEYVPGVTIRRRDKLKEFRLLNNPVDQVFNENPLMLVDAMPVFNSDVLVNFNPKFFQKLEVLNREFYLNDRSYSGVISFSSYENNFGLFPVPDQVLYLDYKGVHPFIEFPELFGSKSIRGKKEPDFRSVLFWQHDGNTSAALEFNTSGLSSVYQFTVRYLDRFGEEKEESREVIIK